MLDQTVAPPVRIRHSNRRLGFQVTVMNKAMVKWRSAITWPEPDLRQCCLVEGGLPPAMLLGSLCSLSLLVTSAPCAGRFARIAWFAARPDQGRTRGQRFGDGDGDGQGFVLHLDRLRRASATATRVSANTNATG